MSRTEQADTFLLKEKEHKKELKNFERFSQAIKMQYSFKKLQVFEDLLKACGFDQDYINKTYFVSERSRRLTFKDVNDYLDDRRIELTTRQWLSINPPIITYDNEAIEQFTEKSKEAQGTNVCTKLELVDSVSNKNVNTAIERTIKEDKEPEEPFLKSPNESPEIFFFWFQKKAINNLMKGILGE